MGNLSLNVGLETSLRGLFPSSPADLDLCRRPFGWVQLIDHMSVGAGAYLRIMTRLLGHISHGVPRANKELGTRSPTTCRSRFIVWRLYRSSLASEPLLNSYSKTLGGPNPTTMTTNRPRFAPPERRCSVVVGLLEGRLVSARNVLVGAT